jgi:hypothetical protein
MSEGTDYANDLTLIVQLITALEYIVSIMEQRVPEYHPFRRLVAALLDGTFIKCGSCDGTLANDDGSPLHGLREQIDELYECMELLELEVQYELGGEDAEDSVDN